MDYRAFVGTIKGKIYQIDLFEKPKTNQQRYVDSNIDSDSQMFIGHQNRITGLSVNMEGLYLASAADDSHVKIWHINSGQCLQSICCKGPVTTAHYMLFPSTLDQQAERKSSLPVQSLQKEIIEIIEVVASPNCDRNSEWILKRQAEIDSKIKNLVRMAKEEEVVDARGGTKFDDFAESKSDVNAKLTDIKRINADLYNFFVDEIMK